jgi:hypothetical protein
LKVAGVPGGTLLHVSTGVRLDPTLADVVQRARLRAAEAGELVGSAGTEFVSPLSPAARHAIAEWIVSGGYDSAVAAVVTDDPDLAHQ